MDSDYEKHTQPLASPYEGTHKHTHTPHIKLTDINWSLITKELPKKHTQHLPELSKTTQPH